MLSFIYRLKYNKPGFKLFTKLNLHEFDTGYFQQDWCNLHLLDQNLANDCTLIVHKLFLLKPSYRMEQCIKKIDSKGRLISKCPFGVFKSTKKIQQNFCKDFCPSKSVKESK